MRGTTNNPRLVIAFLESPNGSTIVRASSGVRVNNFLAFLAFYSHEQERQSIDVGK